MRVNANMSPVTIESEGLLAIEKGYWGLREDEAWAPKAFEYMPYYEIPPGQEFTAFPVIQHR